MSERNELPLSSRGNVYYFFCLFLSLSKKCKMFHSMMKILCHSKHGSDDIFTGRDRKGKFSLTGVCPRVGLASQRALQVT